MEAKIEVVKESLATDILLPLIVEAKLSKSDSDNVLRKISALRPHLKVSHPWQLELLTGHMAAFETHLDKHDDDGKID